MRELIVTLAQVVGALGLLVCSWLLGGLVFAAVCFGLVLAAGVAADQ